MNNEMLILIGSIIAVIFIAQGIFAYRIFTTLRKKSEETEIADTGALHLLQQQIQDMARTIDYRVSESSKTVNESIARQHSESNRIVREVTEGLVKLDETNRQVISFTDQLKSLQDILKNPKQRGVLGEYYLEALLKNVLPPGSYQMQYSFKSGEIVDAVVFVKDRVIPIDSKFSLENYNRLSEARDPLEKERLEKVFVNDLKNRIVETAKYIRPEENTTEFAFMFIPHEAIYYDLLVNTVGAVTEDTENLIQRAAGKYKVIIISPTSFLAYLQTVLQGLKAMQIEEQATHIIKNVGELAKHLNAYGEYHTKLGTSLSTVINHYNASGKEFKKIDKDVLKITGAAAGVEILALDKPETEND